eukprot:s2443_g7.t1
MSSNGQDDSEVVELALELGGLAITVRGSPSQAADFVRRIGPASSAPQSAPSVVSEDRRSEAPAASAASQGYSANLGRSRLSAVHRAERAWLAGQWAKAVLQGRGSSPNRTETIELGNRFWVVLRSTNCTAPRVFTTSAAFFAAVGSLAGSNSVTHAFPSETEARIYIEAAGFEFPGFN